MKLIYLATIILMFISAILQSCGLYSFQNRSHHKFLKSYSLSDSLYFNDYIMYGLSIDRFDFNQIKISSDSLINIFSKSLNKNNLPILMTNNGYNFNDKKCIEKSILKYKNIDVNCLKEIIKIKNRSVIFPVIELSFGTSHHTNVAGSDKHYISILDIAIFIFKNDEVIYFKQMKHTESVYSKDHPYEYEDFHIPISQKHWDGLIKELLKEYIERLE